MQDLGYLKPRKTEFFPISIITFVLALMYSVLIVKLSPSQNDLVNVFIPMFIFFNILFHLKLVFMKFMGLKKGIQLELDFSYLDQYGFRSYEKITNIFPDLGKKGLSTVLLSILIYVITLGFVIMPAMWKIKYKKISHLYHGMGDHHEMGFAYTRLYDVNEERIAKTYLVGFIFYFLFAQLIEILLKGTELYIWFIASIFYLAFFTFIPIPGFEGFELFKRNRMYYTLLLPILTTAMLAIIVFESAIFTTLVVLGVFSYIYLDKLIKKLTH